MRNISCISRGVLRLICEKINNRCWYKCKSRTLLALPICTGWSLSRCTHLVILQGTMTCCTKMGGAWGKCIWKHIWIGNCEINTSANSFADKGDSHMTCREMSLAPTLTGIAMKHHGRSIFFGKQRGVVPLHWLQNRTIQNVLGLVLRHKYLLDVVNLAMKNSAKFIQSRGV